MGMFPSGAVGGGHAVNPEHTEGHRTPACSELSQLPHQYHHLGQFTAQTCAPGHLKGPKLCHLSSLRQHRKVQMSIGIQSFYPHT